MFTEKGIIPAYLLVLIMVGLFVGGIYFGKYIFDNNDVTASPTPDATSTVTYDQAKENSLPTSMPSVSASPKVVVTLTSPPFEIKKVGSENIYIDHMRGFSFKFSSTLTLGAVLDKNNFVQFLERQAGSGNVVRMTLDIYDNKNVALSDLIKDSQVIPAYDQGFGLTEEKLTVDGNEALKLTKSLTQAELCNWDDGENKKRTFYFLVKGKNYIIKIHPNNSCESYKRDWFEITPQSFDFL